jgi:CHAT domain-containing protein
MRIYAIFFLLLCFALKVFPQSLDTAQYRIRYSKLQDAFQNEKYQEAISILNAQLKSIEQARAFDSLYRYASFIGRCNWKTSNALTGQREAEKLIDKVIKLDPNKNHHLTALSELSWFYYETGNDSLCMKTDERYLDICLNYPDVDMIQLSNGYYNLGFDYLAIGDGKKSVDFFKQSIQPLLKDSVLNAEDLLKRYNALGSGLYRLGDYRAAKVAYTKTLFYAAMAKDNYQIQSNTANSYGNMSLVALDEGDYILAKEYLEKSLQHREQALKETNDPDLIHQENDNKIKGYSNLASIYLRIGEFELTEKLLNLAKSEKAKLLEANDPRLNLINESFGSYYLSIGETDKALESILSYKSGCLLHYGEKSFWTGFANKRLGMIYQERKEFDLAILAFSDAIRIFEMILDEESSQDLADVLVARSKAFARSGDLTNSNHDYQRAFSLLASTRNEHDPKLAYCKFIMAENYFVAGEYIQASSLIEEALYILEKYRNHLNKFTGRLKGLIPYLPDVYYLKARITLALNQDKKGQEQSLDLIRNAITEIRASQMALDHNSSRLEYYNMYQKVFQDGTDLLYNLYVKSSDSNYLDEVLKMAEENKTVMLRRQLSAFGSLKFAEVPDSIQQKENELINKLQSTDIIDDQLGGILKSEKDLDHLLVQLEKEYPRYFEMKYGDRVADIQRVQKELCLGGKNVLEFIGADSVFYAMIISENASSIVPIPRNGLSDLIMSYNNAVVRFDYSAIDKLGHELYQRIFLPLEKTLSSHEVLIVPDDEIFNVNFDILQRNPTGGIQGLLIQDFTFSYLLSVTTALQFKALQKEHGVKGILALAPGFTNDQKERYANQISGLKKLDNSFLNCIQQPFALRSASHLVEIIPGISLTGDLATEENFRQNVSKYDIIHFGTHTEVNNESPLLSRLILSSDGKDSLSANDGYLHAYEIYDMSLQAELAVLTACQTGTGKPNNSEGVFSLAYGFAYAGCPSVVMSLWQVDEKTSIEIIENFYENLSEGMPRNEALRQAKLKYLSIHGDELASPYYWAGMVLLGETESIEVNKSNSWYWILFVITVLIVITAFKWKVFKSRTDKRLEH